MKRFWLRQALWSFAVLVIGGTTALAKSPATPPNHISDEFLPEQLDNLVAPIALYPDPLLGQVLVASRYPPELLEAQHWFSGNGNLSGEQLTKAAHRQSWDASVQALVVMPEVLAKLTENIGWTTDLGNAFVAQPADVMGAIQRMRARAQANGKLRSSAEARVFTQNRGGQQVIEIQPANPEVIYVPTYDPTYVWGPPDQGIYPGLFYPRYGFWYEPGIQIR